MHAFPGKPKIVSHGDSTVVFPVTCVSYHEPEPPHDIFHKGDAFVFPFQVFLLQIIIAFLLSWSLYFVLRPLRQPKFVCNVLAGFILGPSVLGRSEAFMKIVFPDYEMLVFNTVSRMGTGYLIFIISVKMDKDVLLRAAKEFWPFGLWSFCMPFLVILCVKLAVFDDVIPFMEDFKNMAFVSMSMAVNYFPTVAQVLEELDLLTTEFGQLALSSTLIIQMACRIFLVAGEVLRQGEISKAVFFLVITCSTVIFAVFILRPMILLIIKTTPDGKPVKEGYVIAILVGTLIMAAITDFTWDDFLSGCVLMGLIIPNGQPLGATLAEKSELMITEFFLPLFFVQVGYTADVYSLKNVKSITVVIILTIACWISKMMGTLLASWYLNIKFENAILLAIVLNFKGVVDMINFHKFRTRDMISKEWYTTLVLFNVIFKAIFYPLIDIFYKPKIRLAGRYYKARHSRALQSTPQCEELRAIACIYHEDNVRGIIALLQACTHKAISPLCAYVVHVTDLMGRTAPMLIPYKSRKRTCNHKSSSSSHIMHAFVNHSKTADGHFSVQPFTMVAPFKSMHEIICNLAKQRQVPFIIVPFHQNETGMEAMEKILLHDSNSQLQIHAPCTVGIYLDRGLKPRVEESHQCPYHVVVLFVGGADDREALALAIRMSGNPDVNISVVRINSAIDKDNQQSQLDDLLMKEFMKKNGNNPSVVCHQVRITDCLEILNVVQEMTKRCDLVILGKNSGARTFEKEMIQWVEHPEIGVLGDMFASHDFHNKNTSVLVMATLSSSQ